MTWPEALVALAENGLAAVAIASMAWAVRAFFGR